MGDPGPIYITLGGGRGKTYRFHTWQRSSYSDQLEFSEEPTDAGFTDVNPIRQLPLTLQFTVSATGDDTFVEEGGEVGTLDGGINSQDARTARFVSQVERMRSFKGMEVSIATRYIPQFRGIVRSVDIDDEGDYDDYVHVTFEVRTPPKPPRVAPDLFQEGTLLVPGDALIPPDPAFVGPQLSVTETVRRRINALSDGPQCIKTSASSQRPRNLGILQTGSELSQVGGFLWDITIGETVSDFKSGLETTNKLIKGYVQLHNAVMGGGECHIPAVRNQPSTTADDIGQFALPAGV